jgi:hypothetical protein
MALLNSSRQMTLKHTCTKKIKEATKVGRWSQTVFLNQMAPACQVLGEFYAANNHGIFISTDSGETWRRFTAEWPKKYLQQTVWAITVSE